MNLKTITMPVEEAREKAREYRAAFKRSRSAEDEAIWRGSKALAQGHDLVDVTEAVKAGGEDQRGFPRIAVCAADAVWCYLDRTEKGTVRFYPNHDDDPAMPIGPRAFRRVVAVRDAMPTQLAWDRCSDAHSWSGDKTYRTQVPIVPPPLRPLQARSLRSFRILWEVEEWSRHTPPRPPGDPALLRHVTGTLYAVVAMWDLTELERAVLGARQ